MHKKPFSLKTGESLDGSVSDLNVFPCKVEGGLVLLKLPVEDVLDAIIGTPQYIIKASKANGGSDSGVSAVDEGGGCTSCSDDRLAW